MVVVEVVQASIHGWVVDEKSRNARKGIYLDIYPLLFNRGLCCAMSKATSAKTMRCTTGVMEEAAEMQFRRYSEDGIIRPLAVLGGPRFRTRKGEEIELAIDVFRIPYDREECDELEVDPVRHAKVCSMFGSFRAGAWEPAVLRPTARIESGFRGLQPSYSSHSLSEDVPEAVEQCAVLELRPVSSRPFMLKNAKPPEPDGSLEGYFQGKKLRRRSAGIAKPWHPVGVQAASTQGRGSRFSNNFQNSTKLSANSSWVSSFLSGGSSSSYAGKVKEENNVERYCTEWRPGSAEAWLKFWSNIWPEQDDNLCGRHEVIPLMETEFRRDCIVFYNTLFPRYGRNTFALLRDTVLDSSSKAPFKLLPPRMEPKRAAIAESCGGSLKLQEVVWFGHQDLRSRPILKHNLSNLTLLDSCEPKQPDEYSDHESDIAMAPTVPPSPTTAGARRSDNAIGVRNRASDVSPERFLASEVTMRRQLSRPRMLCRPTVPSCGDCSAVPPIRHEDERAEALEMERNFSYLEDDDEEVPLIASSEHVRKSIPPAREVRVSLDRTSRITPREATTASFEKTSASFESPIHSESLGARNFRQYSNGEGQYSSRSPATPMSPAACDVEVAVGTRSATSLEVYRGHGPGTNSRGDKSPAVEAEASKPVTFKSLSAADVLTPVVPGTATPGSWADMDVSDCSPSASHPSRQGSNISAMSNRSALSWMPLDSSGTGIKSSPLNGLRCVSTTQGVFLDEYSPRITLLKRLFICFAYCGVHYSEVSESSQIGDPWPYPLASVLGHGCRVLIRLEDIEANQFLNFLLTGDPDAMNWKATGVPPPLKPRIAATHSVSIETETGRIFERRLHVTSGADNVQNFKDGLKKKHLGLDIPVGGVGNQSPMGRNFAIGFRGEAYQVELIPTDRSERTSIRSERLPICHRRSNTSESTGTFAMELSCKLAPDVQGGHMYIRTDDFGFQIGSSSWADQDSEISAKEATLKRLLEKPQKAMVAMKMVDMTYKVALRRSAAGELFMPSCSFRGRRRDGGTVAHGRDSAGDITLMRVNSEPAFIKEQRKASREDSAWMHSVIMAKSSSSLEVPPSATALRLLLEHYDPVNAEMYGTPPFKSFEDLFLELKDKKSAIMKQKGGGIQRYVEPTIVQLQWKHMVLILRYEVPTGKDPIEKNTFIATRTLPDEPWFEAALRAIRDELNVALENHLDALGQFNRDDDKCHSLIKESTVSPSYPGLLCLYRTHMVQFQIQDNTEDAWRRLGVCHLGHKTEAAARLGCNFMTLKDLRGGQKQKQLFWQWVPRTEAQQMQKFLNMGEATTDERWAKYAFQANGLVRYPPSETALAILLRRCGIDIGKFGTGSYKRLRDFWLELTNEESFLHMTNGRPVRVAEATFVRLRWQQGLDKDPRDSGSSADEKIHEKQMPWHVLVQVREERPDGKTTDRKKLLSTRKGKEETWEDSAIRCIVQDLCITKQQLKSLLAHKTSALSGYLFFEELLKESISYPGIQGSYRTHLVTYILRTSFSTVLSSAPPRKALSNVSSVQERPKYKSEKWDKAEVLQADNKCVKTRRHTPLGQKVMEFEWIEEEVVQSAGVKGVDLWDKARVRQERRRISSVLLGLEGSGPSMKSPFGHAHDASGKSKPTSAVGNHKWKAFRINNALQVPSDENGMRMRITKEMFQELQDVCKQLDILDPGLDLLAKVGQTYDRSYLNRLFAEREFFKHILSSNAQQSREVLKWMQEYRERHPTLSQRASAVSDSCPNADEIWA